MDTDVTPYVNFALFILLLVFAGNVANRLRDIARDVAEIKTLLRARGREGAETGAVGDPGPRSER